MTHSNPAIPVSKGPLLALAAGHYVLQDRRKRALSWLYAPLPGSACAIISEKSNVIDDLAIEGMRRRVWVGRYHRRSLRFRNAGGIGT